MTTTRHTFRCQLRGEDIHCGVPYIVFKVGLGDAYIDIEGWIDSGSEMVILDADIADYLDINLDELKPVPFKGASGNSFAYCTTVLLEIEGHEPFMCEVGFVKGLPVSGLLGHKDFFDQFNISFKKKEGFIELEKH
jgi:hypothetical protein